MKRIRRNLTGMALVGAGYAAGIWLVAGEVARQERVLLLLKRALGL
ncbi:MAG: hypothetical protein AB7E47_13770 [Desulfovibrionaceae bacterium]